uniref:RlpA-like protein double-psi beta-barrel domain-containing protein n=1 Tax=Leersia perrieri TaxID=77586 RepID=A0A0D9XKX4_9ORYZ
MAASGNLSKIAVLVAAIAIVSASCAVARRHNNNEQVMTSADGGGGSGGFPAVMTVNGFEKGEEGGGPSACDGRFHSDGDLIAALSTEWFAGGRRCHKRIRIVTRAGRAVVATVVDECDTRRGCKSNIVDTSPAVWKALGLDTDAGEVRVTCAKIVMAVAVLAAVVDARRHHHAGGGFPAVMTVNGFGKFHGDGELIAELSTEWFAGGRRCHKRIRIVVTRGGGGGRAVEATVVDECDTRRGCKSDIMDSSPAVWRALGLDTDAGELLMVNAKLALLATLALLLASCAAGGRHHHHNGDECGGGRCTSPAVTGETPAVMTVNGFEKGEEGGGPAACDGRFHSDKSMVAALSTGWFAGGSRCHKGIRVTSRQTGRSVVAIVVDECDSRHGCKDNIVDTSAAVWEALGLHTVDGEVPVTWSDV